MAADCVCGHPHKDHTMRANDGRTTACGAEFYSEDEGVDYPCSCIEYDPDDGHPDIAGVCSPSNAGGINDYNGIYGHARASTDTP